MPAPMSGLMAELLPLAGRGWAQGSERYGLPPNTGTFGVVNCWGYYSPGVRGAVDLDAMERVAAESLATRRWRTELQRWREEVRPAVVAANRRLLAVDLGRLTDEELAAHVQDARRRVRAVRALSTSRPSRTAAPRWVHSSRQPADGASTRSRCSWR